MSKAFDTISGELIRNELLATITDMGETLLRNAISLEIVEEKDFSNALVMGKGQVVITDNVLHLGSSIGTSQAILGFFKFSIKSGDIIATNDPYSGGNHTSDFTLLRPFYFNREHICNLICRAHLSGVGGQEKNSYYPFAKDIWGEGSRITPVKIIREGKIVSDVYDSILINSRTPEIMEVNLNSMLSALEIGHQRLSQIVEKYGAEHLSAGMDYCINFTKSSMESKLLNVPDGEWTGSASLDHDCKNGENIKVNVRISKKSNQATIDFTGSSLQSEGFVNSSRTNTISLALIPFCTLLKDECYPNSGLLDCINIITPEGTVVNPAYPSPVGWGPFHIGGEIVTAVTNAISTACPLEMGGLDPRYLMAVANWPVTGKSFPLHVFVQGGAGATREADGWGIAAPFSRSRIPSIEMVESEFPLSINRLEFWEKSAGKGTHRGAYGTLVELEFSEKTMINTIIENRTANETVIEGAEPGTPNTVIIDGKEVTEGYFWGKEVTNSKLQLCMGGGSGWGRYEERSQELLLQDRKSGLSD